MTSWFAKSQALSVERVKTFWFRLPHKMCEGIIVCAPGFLRTFGGGVLYAVGVGVEILNTENGLELRAVGTALRWRIGRKGWLRTKFVHLVDSQVCLRALSRGRSSSRKLRRTLLKIDSLLLVSGCHAVWAYVHTDRPVKRWVK